MTIPQARPETTMGQMASATSRVMVAGFGGQGIVFMGKLLATAALLEGKNVTCLPSYGPEMRGGTANCMVTISPRKIGSPYFTTASSLIAMNLPSLERFEPTLESGGFIVLNSSLVSRDVTRTDVSVTKIQANEIAEGLGNVQVANMVTLGAFSRTTQLVHVNSLIAGLNDALSASRRGMVSLDEEAIRRGGEFSGTVGAS